MDALIARSREMPWCESNSCDPVARRIADRHYSRQKPGSTRFVPPGRCFTVMTGAADALWVSSWPYAEYVKHAWAGAWICSLFRREPGCPIRASSLITPAVAATRWYWGDVPELGMVTFVNPKKVPPTMVRGRPVWGYCFLKAGWKHCGHTKGGLVALKLDRDDFPDPCPPREPPVFVFGLPVFGCSFLTSP